jgi:cytoskeletal protein RodZ
MKFFTKNKISADHEEAAEKLKQARLTKGLGLDAVAKNLNINIKYLDALEKSQIEKLPAGIYGKNYLREYAKFLGLNPEEIIELYGLSNNETINQDTKNLFSQKVPGVKYFLSLPKIITNIIIILLVCVCVGYLGFYLKKIIAPPTLTITNPAGDITINKNSIDIQGLTEPEAEVIINGELVLTNPNGFFTKKVSLKNGLNIIAVSAQKKYSQKNYIEKKILVKN